MIRVLVVDDHPIFRDGLAATIDAHPDTELAGVAADAPAAFEAAARGEVDVVLMDINMPGESGIAATARITALANPPAVLMVTMVDDDETVLAALRAGARGYVLKGATSEEIVAAIRSVASGGAVFGEGVAGQILALSTSPALASIEPVEPLSAREREVLELLAEGRSNGQIARDLGLSIKTIQNHVSRILDKLQVRDRTQAALRARQLRPPS